MVKNIHLKCITFALPYYQCFEAMSISAGDVLIFEQLTGVDAALPLFIVAYNKCGPLLSTNSNNSSHFASAQVPLMHFDNSDVILYEFSGIPKIPLAQGSYVFPDAHYEQSLR